MQELGKLIPTQETVLIVGAGFMGTATAIRLLHHAQFPLEIILLEKEDEQRCGGLAYSRSCAGWEHLLNIQAGRITLFREHPNDFLEWANLESNRSQWPEKWQKTKFHETSAVPRIIYQQYVHERLIQAQKKAFKDVTLTWMSGEAVDIIEQEKTAIVTIISSDDNQNRQITKREVEQVILATGHREAVLPVFAQNFKEHPRFVLDQYSQRGQKIIHNIDPNETVFILGTALSSFDAILSLLAQNHQGQIVLCSRHGFTHFTYPSNHLHEIVKLPRPSFLDNDNLCLESLKEEVSEAYKQAFSILKQNRTDIDESVLSERILKAWEPYIVELVNRLQPEKIQKLLNEHNSLIVTKRIGTIPEIGNSIAAKIHSFKKTPSQIRMIKGEITKIEKTENSHRLKIEIKQIDPDDIHSIKVGYVISCLGRKSDYRQIQSPLWRNLIDVQKLAIPHQKTGRGIEVGDYGEVINAQGKPSQILYAVGPMRQGDEIEKRGRSGAFVFSLGTIRNQALITALKVLEMLKEKKNEQTKGFPSLNLNPKSEKVGKLIANEAVKRTQKPLTEVEKYGLKKSIKQIINSVLYGQLIVHKLEALVTLEPQDREVFEQKIMAVAKQLKTLLVATGLEENLIQDVVAETTKQAQKIAIYRLTDISKLAGTAYQKQETIMPRIQPLNPENTAPIAQEVLCQFYLQRGSVPNMFRTLALRPEMMVASYNLMKAVLTTGTLEQRLKEMVIVRTSQLNQCTYCVSSHSILLRNLGVSQDAIEALDNPEDERWQPCEKLALRYAEQVTKNAKGVSDRLWNELKQYFDEGQLVELTTAIGLFNMFNRFNEALQVELTTPGWVGNSPPPVPSVA